ncbi:MAG: hypothetical protein DRP01_04930 [Archaeoglobales archaeon]|nr:MAG: hypothetical protein DRP01_04930 [Archaeoglobales archaeon]
MVTTGTSYSELQDVAAEVFGLNPNSTKWSKRDQSRVSTAILRGFRQFLNPPALTVDLRNQRFVRLPSSHEWSFIHETFTITTESGTADYDLPSNFRAVKEKRIYFPSNLERSAILERPPSQIREWRTEYPYSSYPQYYAIEAKDHSASTGTAYQVMLYPTPDSVLTLTGTMLINLDKLSSTGTIPPGADEFANAITASVMAAAEFMHYGFRGPYWEEFLREVNEAIQRDLENHEPEIIGDMNIEGLSVLTTEQILARRITVVPPISE